MASSTKSEPKYLRLADRLKQQIETGKLQAGDTLPSFKELRRSTGISQFTYEKAYEILEREGVAVRKRGRYGGTFVTPRPGHTTDKPVGYFRLEQSQTLHQSYWARLLDGVRQEAARNGHQVLLVDDVYSFTAWDSISAALIIYWLPQYVTTFRQLIPAELPIVSLLMPTGGVPSVVADDFQGTYEAVEYLHEQGHQRIAFLSDQPHRNHLIRVRKEGYLKALRDNGITPQPTWVYEPFMLNSASDIGYHAFGRHAMREWLQDGFTKTGCTALLTQNDYVAYGALAAFTEAGWNIPDDISIIGFDGLETGNPLIIPKLTTLEVPLQEIGAAAVNHVLSPAPSASVFKVPLRLYVGDTTGPAK